LTVGYFILIHKYFDFKNCYNSLVYEVMGAGFQLAIVGLIRKTKVLENLNLVPEAKVLDTKPVSFVQLIIHFASAAASFTFAAAKCIIAIKFAFKSFFHCLFQFKTVLTSYQLKG